MPLEYDEDTKKRLGELKIEMEETKLHNLKENLKEKMTEGRRNPILPGFSRFWCRMNHYYVDIKNQFISTYYPNGVTELQCGKCGRTIEVR